MSTQMLAEQFQANANLFGFLARLWIAELDEDSLSRLTSSENLEIYQSLGGVAPKEDSDSTESLEIEYCGCFLGPKDHLPPYQSVVNHSHFQGDCVESLKTYLEVIGKPAGGSFERESMNDHAGILLAMMQRVLDAQAVDTQSTELQSLSRLFFEAHVNWIIDYCNVAITRSKSEFYSGLFRFTANFLVWYRDEHLV